MHRWLGIVTGLVLIAAIMKLKNSEFWSEYKKSALLLVGLVVLQIVLGILTIIYVVPIHLAATHQFVAALLVLAYFKVWFQQPKTQKV